MFLLSTVLSYEEKFEIDIWSVLQSSNIAMQVCLRRIKVLLTTSLLKFLHRGELPRTILPETKTKVSLLRRVILLRIVKFGRINFSLQRLDLKG